MFWLSDPGRSSDGMSLFEIEVVLLRPRGRGSVRLRSADPADAPRVELPNFRDDFDVERLAEGYDRALDVARSPRDSIALRRDAGAGRTSRRGGACERLLPTPCRRNLLDGSAAGGRRGRRRMRTRLRSGATQRRRRVDYARCALGFTHIPTIMIAERLSDEIVSLL
jgi:choline dehydrogenase